MFDKYDIQGYGSSSAEPKYNRPEKPRNLTPAQIEAERRELINRNSFGSVNNNKHLDRALKRLKTIDIDADNCAAGLVEILK